MGNQPASQARGSQPPQRRTSQPPPASSPAPEHVRCPSCSKVLRAPPGAARFRCPCGKVLGAPAPAPVPIPSQTRSLPPQQQPAPHQHHQPIQSQNRSVPPQRQQQQTPIPPGGQRVRCPRCQQILIAPNGAPQFSCPCGQMLRAPPTQVPPNTGQQQRPAPQAPGMRNAPLPPTSQPTLQPTAAPSRVRCPNCSRVLDCPPGQRIFPCVCGVHLTAPGMVNPPPPPPAQAASVSPTPSHSRPDSASSASELPTAEALLSVSQKDVGSWRRSLHANDSRLGWIHVLSETDDARILQAEQVVMESLTPAHLQVLSNTELKRRLQRFGNLVDLTSCIDRDDLLSIALDLSMSTIQGDLRTKCAELDIDISKCRTDRDVSQRLFAYVWSDGKTFTDNCEKNDGFVRTVTGQNVLQWTSAQEFLIPMGSPDRALEVFKISAGSSFVNKAQWFRQECSRMLTPWESGHVKVVVKRDTCLEDAFNHIYNLPASDMHRYFRYEFSGEPGLDAGGVAREWFSIVSDQVFNADVGLMEYSQAGNLTYQISTNSQVANGNGHLAWFRFIGRLLGRTLFEGQQIGPHLTRILYKHMLAWPIVEADLEFVDDEMFKSVGMMREMEAGIEDLCLDFTTTKAVFGENVVVELCENGASRDVTNENLDEFLELRLKHCCMGEVQAQLYSFLNGFYEVIPIQLLSVFNFFELELLLCGLPHISVEDWKRNTVYRGEYAERGENHPVVQMFWLIMEESNEEQRAKFLQFATGTSRVPVQGFSALQGNDGNIKLFTIDSVQLTQSVFPKAHTCFNRIDLPLYSNKVDMKFRMGQALQLEGVGFQIE
ncbi:hypothetical protein BASA81_007072 [Batrachochytrium salamandrivorans]|nr:hypothetical protein BASA81_007072 [Batrachochytrium salamandrivorans]